MKIDIEAKQQAYANESQKLEDELRKKLEYIASRWETETEALEARLVGAYKQFMGDYMGQYNKKITAIKKAQEEYTAVLLKELDMDPNLSRTLDSTGGSATSSRKDPSNEESLRKLRKRGAITPPAEPLSKRR